MYVHEPVNDTHSERCNFRHGGGSSLMKSTRSDQKHKIVRSHKRGPDNFNKVYEILLNEVLNDNVYFKQQNLCKHHVLHGGCNIKQWCTYDHPHNLTEFFTGCKRCDNEGVNYTTRWNLTTRISRPESHDQNLKIRCLG